MKFTCIIQVMADDISLEVSAPSEVIEGKEFRMIYTINAHNTTDFQLSSIPEMFDVIMGPGISTSSSIQVVNGEKKTSVTTSYTYVLSAKQTGDFRIGPATVKKGDKQYESNPVSIKVFPFNKENNNITKPAEINDDDVFIRAIIADSGKNVYVKDSVLVTFKIYSVHDLASVINIRFPDFENFISDEVKPDDTNQQWRVEQYNGLSYNTAIVKKYVLFPKRSGRLQIGSASMDITIRAKKENSQGGFLDNFFDNGEGISKEIKSPPVTINVEPGLSAAVMKDKKNTIMGIICFGVLFLCALPLCKHCYIKLFEK